MKTKFIVVAGGVISGVGKGVTTASLGKILQKYGYTVTLIKIDPYINYDAGTLRPTEHGEVWVTEDGGEIDQDLGTYERFINLDISKKNNITTGQIYKTVIDRERAGHYLGQTVQFVPHILDEIKQRIINASHGKDFAIVELGGTVGDYENTPFLFALKSLEREIGSDAMAYCLVTYLPVPDHAPEMKTKPTQQAIRLLGQEGILPDFIICRAKVALDETRKKKIESCAYVSSDHVICAPDIDTVYEMPLFFEKEKLGLKILNHFKIAPAHNPDWSVWAQLVEAIKNPAHNIKIAIIGKYLESGDYSLTDSYLSIEQALVHAAAHKNVGFDIEWINAQEFEEQSEAVQRLSQYDGIIIPGGFGNSGVEGKIAAITYARVNKIPLLGLCYGLQLAVVEYARNVAGLHGAHTIEVNQSTPYPVITLLEYQRKIMDERSFGGTMRLGGYNAIVDPLSVVAGIYKQYQAVEYDADGNMIISERHRHRYEVNPEYVSILKEHGLTFSGYYMREDNTQLMEFIELSDHPFFVATQAHPEFKSRLESAHPLFTGFISACIEQSKILNERVSSAIAIQASSQLTM